MNLNSINVSHAIFRTVCEIKIIDFNSFDSLLHHHQELKRIKNQFVIIVVKKYKIIN